MFPMIAFSPVNRVSRLAFETALACVQEETVPSLHTNSGSELEELDMAMQ